MGYKFRGQHPSENVLAVIRRHPIVLLRPGYLVLGLLTIPWIIFVLSSGITAPFGWSFLITLLLALWFTFNAFYTWVNDVYLITTERVLATNQKDLLSRVISEVPYDKVQEISHEVSGIKSLLNIGDVIIKTASQTDLILKDVLDPYEVEQMIAKYVHTK